VLFTGGWYRPRWIGHAGRCYAGFDSVKHRLPLSNLSPGKYFHERVRTSANEAAFARANALSMALLLGEIVKPFTSPPASVPACDEPECSPEGPVFRDYLHFALSVLLLAFALPLLAISILIAALSTAVVAICPGFLKTNERDGMALKKLRVVNRFNPDPFNADRFNADRFNADRFKADRSNVDQIKVEQFSVDQFNFAGAMNAYEELIGAHGKRQR
jgi:hypothetical protein